MILSHLKSTCPERDSASLPKTIAKRGSRLNFQADTKEEIKKLADDLVHGYVDDHMVRICKICMKVRAVETICKSNMRDADEKCSIRITYGEGK